jgi:Xaa-Pro dipeptidase
VGKLEEIAEKAGVDALVIGYEWNVFYFARLPRPGGSYILYVKGEVPKLLVPALDFWRASDTVKEYEVIPYAKYALPEFEAKLLTTPLPQYIKEHLMKSGVKKVGLDLGLLTQLTNKLSKELADLEVVDIANEILNLRAIKEEEELVLMKEAVNITEEALKKALPEIREGMKEYEVVALLEGHVRFLGSDGYAFETIVASGPNASYPHAVPTPRTLTEGDTVVIDLGARYGGYCADMTRTLIVGRVHHEIKKVIEAVNEALWAATDAVAPGVKGSEVDSVARNVLKKYGLSKYFIHSTGHGVGVEVHEKPRLAQKADEELKPGMAVTIEPGVYVPKKFGVRIENIVVVTKSGREVMNKLDTVFH